MKVLVGQLSHDQNKCKLKGMIMGFKFISDSETQECCDERSSVPMDC